MVARLKGPWSGCLAIKGVRPRTKLTCEQTVHSSSTNNFCTILFVMILFVPMTLSQKTQNQVLGRSAGVPCEVASGLRSQCFIYSLYDV